MAEFVKKEKQTRKDVVLEFIKKVGDKSANEFKGGYWVNKDKGNWVEKIYIPDSRKEYIQCVEFLSDLLLPEITKTIKKDYDEIIEEVNQLLKDYEAEKITQEEYTIKKHRQMRLMFQRIIMCLETAKFWKKEPVYG